MDWKQMASSIESLLQLDTEPLAITFSESRPAGVPSFDEPMPPPSADGRTGRVPAGCVFWFKAVDRTFSTVAEDHGNCSVGLMTHGFATMEEVAGRGDVATLLETGWVTMEVVPQIPVVPERPGAVTYGPLAATPVDPDVVLLRLNPKQLMVLMDALPGLRVDSKPQCHIVALAKEGTAAASAGCMLSRVRTGMPNEQMTAALPARQLPDIVARLEQAGPADVAVARYAGEDKARFA